MSRIRLFALLFACAVAAAAQMSANPFLSHTGSGTDAEPNSAPVPMLMAMRGGWTFMLHGTGFATLQQQTGPRGADKFFAPNWVMGMAQCGWGPGRLTFRSMLSLEPATITGRFYPELFQTGETAFGRPIVDGQHPHNFFMELAAIYDWRFSERAAFSLYAAPVGDPALGPEAFPHRLSAAEDPLAPLGHHLEDSTHISASVVTAGLSWGAVRLEASGFHGREPGENRWALVSGGMDSWSTRLTVAPAPDWSGQVSFGHLHSPEALDPSADQLRITASLAYNRPLAHGNWANTLLWGRTRPTGPPNGDVLNGYLLESNLALAPNHLWTRIENVDKSNELLFAGVPEPPGFAEVFLARIQAYSFGYARDLASSAWFTPSLGAQWTAYCAPASLTARYGHHPQGVALFLRLLLGRER